jgi:two-component system, chemotaxis family, CheB/CheR fusion protein
VISRKTRQAVFVDQPWRHGVVDILRQPVVVLDQSHRILAASNAFCELVGATPQDAAGRGLRDVGNRLLNSPGLEEFLDMIEPGSTTADHHYQLEIDKGLPGGRAFSLTAQRIPERLASGTTIVVIEEVSSSASASDTADSLTSRTDQRAQFSIAAADHDLRQPLQTLGLLQGVLAAREKDPDLRALVARFE